MGNYYLAVDIGASSGRHMLASMENGKMKLEEVYRFPNGMDNKNGTLCWDVDRLFTEIKNGLKKCKELGKIPALLTFFPEIALHVTRPIRWDSDHVVLFDDETKEIAKEIVRCENGIDRTYIALDYFDASINRISAWVTGFRSFQKALLDALCQPSEMLKEFQDTNQMSKKMVVMEQCKTLPIGDVWEEYCRQCGVETEGWFDDIQKYEDEVLSKRA